MTYLLVIPRPESDKKSAGMLSAAYQKTSKNAASPGEPIKLMIHTDLCTKQRDGRMGFCVKEGHSWSYCVFYNLMGCNVSPIYKRAGFTSCVWCQFGRNEGSGRPDGELLGFDTGSPRTFRRHAANHFFFSILHTKTQAQFAETHVNDKYLWSANSCLNGWVVFAMIACGEPRKIIKTSRFGPKDIISR